MAIEQKEHDFLLNTLQNPNLSLADFDQLGLNANNTSLLDEDTYKRSKQITDNKLFQNDQGQFDDNKFHQYYTAMKGQYNAFSTNQFSKDLASQTWYDPDDIFAPKNGNKMSKQAMMNYTLMPNPLRLTSSMYEFGKTGPQLMSESEIAQSQKVLANPVEYAKGAAPIWQDAPENSFFDHFFETRVLAQWDEDGEHIDLMTGKKVQHKKGDMKLNENGTYFYENLEGRDVYGKQVLNKLNTITKEGTLLNKWDFFDSDDIKQKSLTGTIMKNLALVGSMFLPYVGPAIAGISVATQTAGLFGTLGKMLIDSDNPIFSEMEGWSKSVSRGTLSTQYAQQNPWCWENFINLVGDVAGQLKEQRFLFEYAPALFKGNDLVSWKKGIDVAKQEAKIAELEGMFKLQNETKFAELQGKAVQGMAKQNFNMMEDAAKGLQELNTKAFYDARRVVDQSLKSYQKVGELLSKAYMTGITVGDTYGEAIQQGASPLEAAMLTLGYAAGEYALLNTGVGEWILPELKDSGLKSKAIARALTKGVTTEYDSVVGNALTKAANETKQSWAKRVFKIGADLANELENPINMSVKSLASRALGEGIEEVSEEFLADASKSMFNLSRYLRGEEGYDWGLENITWSDIKNRYALSFFGGALGGGLTSAFTDFKVNKSYASMDSNQAMQELIWMIKNDEIDGFMKNVDKMTLFDKNLSSKMDEDGNMLPGTKEDNLDTEAKNMIRQQINLIKDALDVNGANISDSSFLDVMTLKDLRFAKMQNSVTAGKMLQAWNTLTARIADTQLKINAIKAGQQAETPDARIAEGDKTDTEKRRTGDDTTSSNNNEQLEKLEKELADLIAYKNELLDGKHSAKFMEDVMFETTDALSSLLIPTNFKQFAEKVTNKEFALIPEAELDKLKDRYQVYVDNGKANDIEHASSFFMGMLRELSPLLKEDAEKYKRGIKDRFTENFEEGSRQVFESSQRMEDEDAWMDAASKFIENEYGDILQTIFSHNANQQVRDRLRAIYDKEVNDSYTEEDKNAEISATIINEVARNIKPWTQKILDSGYIHPETKMALTRTLNKVQKLFMSDTTFSTDYDEYGNPGLLSSTTNYIESYNSAPDTMKPMMFEQLKKLADTYNISTDGIDPLNSSQVEQLADDIIRTHDQIVNDLIATQTEINNLASTPLVQTLQKYLDKISPDNKVNLQEVMDEINNLLADNADNTSNIQLTDELNKKIDYLMKMFNWLGGVLVASQVDNANLNDVWGYTKTINEINKKAGTEDYEDLIEMDSETANMMFQDLNLLRGRLMFMQNLHNINSGNKLQLQSRVGLKRDYLLLNKLEKFIINIPDEYKKNIAIIAEAMSEENAPIYNKYKETHELSLSPDEKEAFTKEVIAIEDAINLFFKCTPELLTNSDKLADFISEIGIYDGKLTELSENTKDIDSHSFLWYLMSRAALRSSDWHNQYKDVINEEFAAIPSQESAIYFATACILQGDIQKTFTEALQKAVIRDWNNTEKRSTEDERISYRTSILNTLGIPAGDFVKDEYSQYIINLPLFAQYKNVAFIEGIAGSGKTSLLNTALELIKRVNPDLVNNIMVVHGVSAKPVGDGSTSVEKLGARLTAAEGVQTLDRESFLQKLTNNAWTEEEALKQIGFEETTDGQQMLRSLIDIDPNISDLPKIIIIDEIGRFNAVELDLIQKAAAKYGITVIACGDLTQSVASGKINDAVKLTSSKNPSVKMDVVLNLTLERAQIPHSFKLAVSMRETNDQQAKNEMIVRNAVMMNDKDEDNPDGIKLHGYFSEDTGLRGTIQIDDEASQKDSAKKYIDDMIGRLKEGEKIGLIYDNENNWLYKMLTEDEKYKDHIVTYQGNSAQGDEHPYYIINFDLKKRVQGDADGSLAAQVRSTFLHDFYTAITRSENGNLLINNLSDFGAIDLTGGITTIMDDSSQSHPYSPQAIAKTSIERKNILNRVLTNPQPLIYTERAKDDTSGTVTTTTTTPPAPPTPGGSGPGVVLDNGSVSLPGSLAGKTNVTSINKNGKDYYIDGDTGKLYDADGKEISNQDVIEEVLGVVKPSVQKYPNGAILYDQNDKQYIVTSYNTDDKQYTIQTEDGTTSQVIEADLDKLTPAAEAEPLIIQSLMQIFNDQMQEIKSLNDHLMKIIKDNNFNEDDYPVELLEKDANSFINIMDGKASISEIKQGLQKLDELQNKVVASITKASTDALNKEANNTDPVTTDNTLEDDNQEYVDKQNATNSTSQQEIIDDSMKKHQDETEKIHIPSLFYNQFSLEINGSIDEDGRFNYFDDDYEKRYAPRIDGVIGLLNLFGDKREQAIKNIPFRSDGNIVGLQDTIGQITQILFSPIDTNKKQQLIGQLLGKNYRDLKSKQVLKIDYFLKNQGLPQGDWFNTTDNPKYGRFDKHINETIDCNTKDGIPVHRKQIVAVMTLNGGQKLEIPILTMANPVSICLYSNNDGVPYYPEFNTFWHNKAHTTDLSKGEEFYKACNEFITKFGDDPKNKPIINRFKIFLRNFGEVFQLQDFDPNTCLTSTGVYFAEQKGNTINANITEQDYLLSDVYNNVPISQFLNDPRLVVSQQIYSTKSGKINGVQVANPGHCFILTSAVKYWQDENGRTHAFNNDKDLWDYYTMQCQNPDLPQLVSIQYVVPPTATFEEFCENFIAAYKAESSEKHAVQNVGNATTIIDVFRKLCSDPQGQQLLQQAVGPYITKEDLQFIQKMVDEYNEIDNNNRDDRTKRITNKLNYLWTPYDQPNANGSATHGNKLRLLHLNALFGALIYPFTAYKTNSQNQSTNYRSPLRDQIAQIIGTEGIRMNPRFEGDNELKIITRPEDNYTINGKEFTINSRITTPVFTLSENSPFDFEGFLNAYVDDIKKPLRNSVRAVAERIYNSDLEGKKTAENPLWNNPKIKGVCKFLEDVIRIGNLDKKDYNYRNLTGDSAKELGNKIYQMLKDAIDDNNEKSDTLLYISFNEDGTWINKIGSLKINGITAGFTLSYLGHVGDFDYIWAYDSNGDLGDNSGHFVRVNAKTNEVIHIQVSSELSDKLDDYQGNSDKTWPQVFEEFYANQDMFDEPKEDVDSNALQLTTDEVNAFFDNLQNTLNTYVEAFKEAKNGAEPSFRRAGIDVALSEVLNTIRLSGDLNGFVDIIANDSNWKKIKRLFDPNRPVKDELKTAQQILLDFAKDNKILDELMKNEEDRCAIKFN